jgi:hypothetical protein
MKSLILALLLSAIPCIAGTLTISDGTTTINFTQPVTLGKNTFTDSQVIEASNTTDTFGLRVSMLSLVGKAAQFSVGGNDDVVTLLSDALVFTGKYLRVYNNFTETEIASIKDDGFHGSGAGLTNLNGSAISGNVSASTFSVGNGDIVAKIIGRSAVLDFNLTGQTYDSKNITVAGAEPGDPVFIGSPANMAPFTTFGSASKVIVTGRVTASSIVTVTVVDTNGGTANPPPATFSAVVFHLQGYP